MYLFRECGTSEDRTVGIFFYGCFIAADFGGILSLQNREKHHETAKFSPCEIIWYTQVTEFWKSVKVGLYGSFSKFKDYGYMLQ